MNKELLEDKQRKEKKEQQIPVHRIGKPEIFLQWDGLWCPCCENKVRTKPHAPHLRAKLLLSPIPRSLH